MSKVEYGFDLDMHGFDAELSFLKLKVFWNHKEQANPSWIISKSDIERSGGQ
ncbi:MAG TPA: hypothetical protein GXX20_07615 [Clostridiaceae bacterium]|nr:hypothetical protein [Clostridiaceae bacterium]